jgi:cytochrome c-type biogenesis protein CcmH/NrfG
MDVGNAKAWRCYGLALHALGRYRDAVAALRRAKQYDPADPSIDADISRSQNGVVTEFLGRRGR